VIFDVDNLHTVQVDQHQQALHRAGVAVVVGPRADERQGPDEAVTRLGFLAVTGGPGVQHRQAEVGDSAFTDRGLPTGVGAGEVFGGEELLEHDTGLHALQLTPAHDGLTVQGDQSFDGLTAGSVIEHYQSLPLQRGDGLAQLLLGRFDQRHRYEPDGRGEFAVGPQDLRGGGDLGGQ